MERESLARPGALGRAEGPRSVPLLRCFDLSESGWELDSPNGWAATFFEQVQLQNVREIVRVSF